MATRGYTSSFGADRLVRAIFIFFETWLVEILLKKKVIYIGKNGLPGIAEVWDFDWGFGLRWWWF